MAMMILTDIKLFWGLIYIISGLLNHLIYHRHKKIDRKLYFEQIWRPILGISWYNKLCFVWLLALGRTLLLLVENKKLEEIFIPNFPFK